MSEVLDDALAFLLDLFEFNHHQWRYLIFWERYLVESVPMPSMPSFTYILMLDFK